MTSILSFLLLGGALAGWIDTGIPLVEVGIVLAIRTGQALRFHMHLWSVVLHPLAMLIFLAIAVNSFVWTRQGEGVRWKGRAYKLRNPPVIL